jgi:hypothetical protein
MKVFSPDGGCYAAAGRGKFAESVIFPERRSAF